MLEPVQSASQRGPPVLVLGGPTASGKTELAAELARAVGGAVVSADSRQVYRGLEIGTAQPDAERRRRAPHYLVGFLPAAAAYSAGRFGEDARRVVAALRSAGKPAVLCGGTGLYLRAAIEGLAGGQVAEPRAGPSSTALERALTRERRRERRRSLAARWVAKGPGPMHAELARVDPPLAARLHPRDRQRVLRGLEFHAEHGRPLSAGWSPRTVETASLTGAPPFSTLRFRLELPAAELARRIEVRFDGMLWRGLMEEARALLERYGDEPPPSLNAVGYPELLGHARGEAGLEETRRRIVLRTRRYAKRQRTWFRHQDGYAPVPAGPGALTFLLDAWRPRLA